MTFENFDKAKTLNDKIKFYNEIISIITSPQGALHFSVENMTVSMRVNDNPDITKVIEEACNKQVEALNKEFEAL